MLSLIATIAMLQAQDQPPRLRTVLENNAIVLVEPMPRAPVISVQLFASAKYVPESEATHGYRHLLEHLIARGDGSIDRTLETQGCFLQASTLRDAMQIQITVGPKQLDLALNTLATLLRKPSITQEKIDKELRVMRDEIAMSEDSMLLASAAWWAAYGEGGLDPLGTFDSMYRATPDKLADTFERQFATDGLVLAIAGPVDLDKATNSARALLGPRPKTRLSLTELVRRGKPGRAEAAGFGECRGAFVPGFKSPQTAAALAAALALASEIPSCFVIYTPTARPGMVLVGRTSSNSGLGLFIDRLSSGAGIYGRGKQMAAEWVRRQLVDPAGVAYLRGLLLCQGESNRPEMILDQIEAMTPKQFDEALRAFASDHAAIAVGTR
jgi:predicted Zn-dependent peptidase